MKIPTVEFLLSADHISKCPEPGLPEIAFAGRSNVGKSSLINSLLKRKGAAKVSSTPGKTRLINFFKINGKFHFVDLPGYGYAKRSKQERRQWARFLEGYIMGRETLKAVVLLTDISVPPVQSDADMRSWLDHHGVRVIDVYTKADKAKQHEIAKRLKERTNLVSEYEPVVLSVKSGIGIDKLWNCLQACIDAEI